MSRQWQPAAVRVGIFENFSENENENENENRVTENRKKPKIFSVTGESIFSTIPYIFSIKFPLLLKILIRWIPILQSWIFGLLKIVRFPFKKNILENVSLLEPILGIAATKSQSQHQIKQKFKKIFGWKTTENVTENENENARLPALQQGKNFLAKSLRNMPSPAIFLPVSGVRNWKIRFRKHQIRFLASKSPSLGRDEKILRFFSLPKHIFERL